MKDPGAIRCLIVTGTGDSAFCPGGDLKERDGMTDEAWLTQHALVEHGIDALLDCPIPVIAAINGAAYGGGCEIALAADFAYAADTARFALTETRLGIIQALAGLIFICARSDDRRPERAQPVHSPFTGFARPPPR